MERQRRTMRIARAGLGTSAILIMLVCALLHVAASIEATGEGDAEGVPPSALPTSKPSPQPNLIARFLAILDGARSNSAELCQLIVDEGMVLQDKEVKLVVVR